MTFGATTAESISSKSPSDRGRQLYPKVLDSPSLQRTNRSIKKQAEESFSISVFRYGLWCTYRRALCPWGSSLSRISNNALCGIISSYFQSSMTIFCSASFRAQLIQRSTTVIDDVYGDSTYTPTIAAGQRLSVVTWKGFFFFLVSGMFFFSTLAVTHLLSSWTFTPHHSSCPLFTLDIAACEFLGANWGQQHKFKGGKKYVYLDPSKSGYSFISHVTFSTLGGGCNVNQGRVSQKVNQRVWRLTYNFSLFPSFSNSSRWTTNTLRL